MEATGLTLEQIHSTGERLLASSATIVCWAMGLTQHKHSVPTLRDVVNVLLLQGNIGKPGAGVCPVRGHSNVQGDRTMGIFEKMPETFHDRLDQEFEFRSPREHGFDTVAAIRAMRDGKVRFFMGDGRQLRPGCPPGFGRDRAGAGQHPVECPDFHEAEPLALVHGPPGADPSHARTHRERYPAHRGINGSPWRIP